MSATSLARAHPVSGEFVSVTQAAILWGISPVTLQRKRKAAGVAVYTSPTDDRLRLMRRTDLVRLLGQPVNQPHTTR